MAKSFSLLRVLRVLWFATFPLFLWFWYAPVITMRIRLITLALFLCFTLGALVLFWSKRIVRWVLVCLYVLLTAFIVLPYHPPVNRSNLRAQYCKSLECYTGCKYVWGGEGRFSMDCSGLVRRGLEDALVIQGFRTCNPPLVREGVWLYWHDTTAKVIGEGYEGRTHHILATPDLNDLDYSLLKPGDLGVTTSGIHIMAYLGNKSWIAADPGAMKVTVFKIPEKMNPYFSTPMNIVRWQVLEN